jgi:hypothetical protein
VWGATIRKEGVFQVTMLRSPPEPAEGHGKPQKIPTWKLSKVQHYSINYTPLLDRWFVNQLRNTRIRSKTGLTTF